MRIILYISQLNWGKERTTSKSNLHKWAKMRWNKNEKMRKSKCPCSMDLCALWSLIRICNTQFSIRARIFCFMQTTNTYRYIHVELGTGKRISGQCSMFNVSTFIFCSVQHSVSESESESILPYDEMHKYTKWQFQLPCTIHIAQAHTVH